MLGVLLDTFVVRALLVPSIVMLLGRWNWWPTRRLAADSADTAPPAKAPASAPAA